MSHACAAVGCAQVVFGFSFEEADGVPEDRSGRLRHDDADDGRGGALGEWLRKLDKDFKKSLKNPERRGSVVDKGEGQERGTGVEGLGLDIPARLGEGRRG